MGIGMKMLVKCTIIVPIEVPDDPDYNMFFDIEDNHCPGTGIVGAKIDEVMERCREKSICWACNLQGKNEIIKESEKS